MTLMNFNALSGPKAAISALQAATLFSFFAAQINRATIVVPQDGFLPVKLAMTSRLAVIVMAQKSASVVSHPDQPANVEPADGVANSVTTVPLA